MLQKNLKLEIISQRLILRPLELRDYENWNQAHSCMHPPNNEWDESNWAPSELTLNKFKQQLKKEAHSSQLDKQYELAVFRKDDGLLIGSVSFMDISRGVFQNAYIGYRIYNNHWGQGYATEACMSAVQFGFKKLKLHRIEAGISLANKESLRVAKKMGLRKEGLSLRRLYVNKKWVDVAIFAMTCEDFGLKYKMPRT